MTSRGLAAATTTPPESSPNSPLTPPRTGEKQQCSQVSSILTRVRSYYNGTSDLWSEFHLSETEYLELLAAVSEEPAPVQAFWNNKLRYDYFPPISKFVLRMPGPVHEQFIQLVVAEITNQLQKLAPADPRSLAFAKDIFSTGSTTLSFKGEYGRHDPDGSFKHRKAQYPGVVLEVAHSQKGTELGHIADDYILGSDGSIKIVIGVNIGYTKDKGRSDRGGEPATLYVWRPKLIRDTDGGDEEGGDDEQTLVAHEEYSVEFRDGNGVPNDSPEAGLSLRLDDFAPIELHRHPMPETIYIPAAILAQFLASVEGDHLMTTEGRGAKASMPSKFKKRRRPRTPEEELSDGAEGRYRADEERAEKRARAEDGTWRP